VRNITGKIVRPYGSHWDLSDKLANHPVTAKKLLTHTAAQQDGTLEM